MPFLYEAEQPEAGPSSRPYTATLNSGDKGSPTPGCSLGNQCPLLDATFLHSTGEVRQSLPHGQSKLSKQTRNLSSTQRLRQAKRQDPPTTSASPASSQTSTSTTSTSSASSTSDSSSGSASGSASSSSSSSSQASSSSSSSSSSSATSTRSQITQSSDESFSAPWSYSKTHTASNTESTYREGVLLPMFLGGDSNSEAVYSVPMTFGHTKNYGKRWSNERGVDATGSGDSTQTLNLEVDLGSSDLWLASDSCTVSDCQSAPALFDGSQSLDAGVAANFTYQSGSVSGEIYWEQMTMAQFSIPFQAFLLADEVSGEDLHGGNFTGILGLALPANSVILQDIPGKTSGAPDGATFLDNLFGAGSSAPSQRIFSLALARREDVRTSSSFGIGTIASDYCKSPCSPNYIPIIAQPSLGAVGFLHWRIEVEGISALKFADAKAGTGSNSTTVTLGPSETTTNKPHPLAILDSGGVPILVGRQDLADALYKPYGVTASSDGLYRMSCTMELAYTFTISGNEYPVHPLDMSWPDPDDPSQTMCIGAIQYAPSVGDSADLVLGSAFMKNVYSIFQYPDNNGSTTKTWQPSVGLISLTNASSASQDFYAVRNMHQSLSSVSASSPNKGPGNSGSSGDGGEGGGSADQNSSTGRTILSTAGIAGISVVGFFLVAAAAFCAWWFWLRRKWGAGGRVVYRRDKPDNDDRQSERSGGTSRSKKHNTTLRQKSMIEGYSDHDGDSWMGTPEGADSIRLGYMPAVLAEQDDHIGRGMPMESPRTSMEDEAEQKSPPPTDRNLRTSSSNWTATEMSPPPTGDSLSPRGRDFSPPAYDSRYPNPRSASTSKVRSPSYTMSGPFPSANRSSTLRPDTSPMYDIQASDFFEIPSGSPTPRPRRLDSSFSILSTHHREDSDTSYFQPRPRPRRTPSGQPEDNPLMDAPDPMSPTGAVFRDHDTHAI